MNRADDARPTTQGRINKDSFIKLDILIFRESFVMTIRFVMIKKKPTFATDFGPIVQWIEWRFPKP